MGAQISIFTLTYHTLLKSIHFLLGFFLYVQSVILFVFCFLCAADIPEEEARYWAKKLEQLNAMRDQDVRTVLTFPLLFLHHLPQSLQF